MLSQITFNLIHLGIQAISDDPIKVSFGSNIMIYVQNLDDETKFDKVFTEASEPIELSTDKGG